MIEWPDIKFPPINLYSMPKQWEDTYSALENEYCKDLRQQYEEARVGTLEKDYLERDLQEQIIQFNKLWNRRARG